VAHHYLGNRSGVFHDSDQKERSLVKPQIGEIVMFKIDPSDFGIWRPLLVTFVNDNGSVEGELFLNWEKDRRREWPSTKLFWGLTQSQRTVEVRNVQPGDAVGNYMTHFSSGSVVGLLRGLAELTARVATLEQKLEQQKEEKKALVQTPPRMPIPEKRAK
jgi:hypothetical protein